MSSMMELLGGAAGIPPAAAPDAAALPPSIPDPQAPAPAAGGSGPDAEVESLKTLLTGARDYMDIPTVEESERLEMEKVTTILQKLIAGNERMTDSVMGTSPALRKVLGPSG